MCHSLGAREAPEVLQRHFSRVAWYFGGAYLGFAYALSRKKRFQCDQCREFFKAHTTGSKIALAILVFLVALIALNLYEALA